MLTAVGLLFRHQLKFGLHFTVITHKLTLVPKLWIAVLDSHDTTSDCVSAGTQTTGLPVQDPFAGKIWLVHRGQTSSIRHSVNKQLRVVVGRGGCRRQWNIVSGLSFSGCRFDRRCSGRRRCAGSCAASATPAEASTSKGAGSCHDSDVLLAVEHEGHWRADAEAQRQRYVEKLFTL